MRTLRGKLDRLTNGGSREPTRWQVWHLDDGVATNARDYPGQTFTRAEAEQLPLPPDTGMIWVCYVDAETPEADQPDAPQPERTP